MKYGSHSETGRIKSIILKHPKDAFFSQDYINAHWEDLRYTECPDYEAVVKEFEIFLELFVSCFAHL